MKKYLVFILFIYSYQAFSQKGYKGIVRDKEDNVLIPHVNMVIKGTTKGTFANSTGYFNLKSKKNEINVIISHVSYQLLDTTLILGSNDYEIRLTKTNQTLEPINLRLGEYIGPNHLIEFDSVQYQQVNELKSKSSLSGEFVTIEEDATFFDGHDNFIAYVASNFQYPREVLVNNLEGSATIFFEITNEGIVKVNEVIVNALDESGQVKAEIERLFREMPKWYPARQRGVPVSMDFEIQILYSANNYGRKK